MKERKKKEVTKSEFITLRIEPILKARLIKKHGKKLTKLMYAYAVTLLTDKSAIQQTQK